jgi:hypothetical protein
MPVQAGSSALLWEEAGGLDVEDDATDLTPKASKIYQPGHRKRDSNHLNDSDEDTPATLRLGGGSGEGVNKDEEDAEDDEEQEEYTHNPDQELEDIQADKHAAYEGQQFYGKIQFGE